jgi:glucuronoarabinoxylan endo-1,4-beta-xylanase
MKKIYSLLFVALFLFLGHSCDDGSLDHSDVYIPDPVEENFEDDGIVAEPTTTAVVRMKIGEENKHQVIDGFGCAFCGWSHRIWNTMQRDAVMEDLFGKSGLALNIYRGEIFPSYSNPTTGDIEFKMDRNFMLQPDDPSMINNYWRNYNGEECGEQMQLGQMWLVDLINRKYKDVNFFFSVWCPPIKWKSNGKLNGGNLKPEYYDEYAKYLLDFVDAYEQKLGIDIYGLSGWNEPDVLASMGGWASCSWSVDQMATFVLDKLRPEMIKRGHNDMKLIYGENAQWKWAVTHINESLKKYPALVDPNLIVAGHGYSTKDENIIPFEEAEKHNIPMWQTELCDDKDRKETWPDAMRWAKTFHTYMAKGNMSAFVWWAGARPCTTTGENLIQLEEALPSTYYYKVPRYYTYGQFTKYIERNARRVDVEAISSETDKFPEELLVSAYIKDDTYTIVLVNSSEKESFSTLIEIEGVEFQNMRTYTSTEYVKWKHKKINPSQSGLRAITVPKYSVVTVTGKIKNHEAE